LHTVKYLKITVPEAAYFHQQSIYKSLTKNYLVVLGTHFFSKQMVYPEKDRNHTFDF